MTYFNESLEFSVVPKSKDYYGLSYDEFRSFLNEMLILIYSKEKKQNLSEEQMKIRSPFHCIVGGNKKYIVIGISTDRAIRKNTILTIIKDMNRDLSVADLEKFLEEVSKREIGYSKNTFMSVDKNIFKNSRFITALHKQNSFIEFTSEMKSIAEKSKAELSKGRKDVDLEKVDNILKECKEMENCWGCIEKAVSEFVKNLVMELHVMQINPIFKARNLVIDENLIFGVLPFTDDRLEIFDQVLKPALQKSFPNMNIIKSGDTISVEQNIMEKIWININMASIVLVDISNRNPNVFYELGICHTLGKPTIIICDEESYNKDYSHKLPFDIGGLNTIIYKNKGNGIDELKKKVINSVRTFKSGKDIILK